MNQETKNYLIRKIRVRNLSWNPVLDLEGRTSDNSPEEAIRILVSCKRIISVRQLSEALSRSLFPLRNSKAAASAFSLPSNVFINDNGVIPILNEDDTVFNNISKLIFHNAISRFLRWTSRGGSYALSCCGAVCDGVNEGELDSSPLGSEFDEEQSLLVSFSNPLITSEKYKQQPGRQNYGATSTNQVAAPSSTPVPYNYTNLTNDMVSGGSYSISGVLCYWQWLSIAEYTIGSSDVDGNTKKKYWLRRVVD